MRDLKKKDALSVQIVVALLVLLVLMFSKDFYTANIQSYLTFYMIDKFGLSVTAVDLGLCDNQGRELDMGTQYLEHNQRTKIRCKSLTEQQHRNRDILVDTMQRAGFVNYPAEWWHFSYGDKMCCLSQQNKGIV